MRTLLRRLAPAFIVLVLAGAAQAQSGEDRVAAIFERDQTNQFVMDVEAALARAQAAHGVVPQAAAAEISAKADTQYATLTDIAAENDIVHHRMVALLNVWRRSMEGEAGEYLHYGATTVDIYDTVRMMQIRRSIDVMLEEMHGLSDVMAGMALEHRDTPMIGRTLGQHALPITFGKKISVWLGENERNIQRLEEVRARVNRAAIMKGAVGTYTGLGEDAIAVEKDFARELGMDEPYPSDWHGARDIQAEYAQTLALISRSYGRIGQELFLLQSTDIGETLESRPDSTVGSSTMPHKNNPSKPEGLMHAARVIPSLAGILLDDVVNFYERDNTSRPNRVIDEISIETAAMLDDARALLSDLQVNEDAMRRNLDRTGGFIMAQRITFHLAGFIGKNSADERVREIAQTAQEEGIGFREALLADPVVSEHITPETLDDLLDPATYLGLSAESVDTVVENARQR